MRDEWAHRRRGEEDHRSEAGSERDAYACPGGRDQSSPNGSNLEGNGKPQINAIPATTAPRTVIQHPLTLPAELPNTCWDVAVELDSEAEVVEVSLEVGVVV